MKKFVFALFLACSGVASAQTNWVPSATAPSGACPQNSSPVYVVGPTGAGQLWTCQNITNGTGTWTQAGGSGATGISGATSGQALIAGSPTTATSSKALAGSGAGITTGPTSSTNTDCVNFSGTGGQIADSGSPSCIPGVTSDGANGLDLTNLTATGTVAAGTTNPVTIGGATGSCAGLFAKADGTGCAAASGAAKIFGSAYSLPAYKNVLLYCDGSSIESGFLLGTAQLSHGGLTGNYCYDLSLLPWATAGTVTYYNDGIAAATSTAQLARYTTGSTQGAFTIPSAHAQCAAATGAGNFGIYLYSLSSIANDYPASISAATTISNYQAIYAAAHADGCFVIALTPTYGVNFPGSAGSVAYLQTIIAALKDGVNCNVTSTCSTTLIPSDMVMDASTWLPVNDTNLYGANYPHPNLAGAQAIANNIMSALVAGGATVNYAPLQQPCNTVNRQTASYALQANDCIVSFAQTSNVTLTLNNLGNTQAFFIFNAGSNASTVTLAAGSSAVISPYITHTVLLPFTGVTIFGGTLSGTTYWQEPSANPAFNLGLSFAQKTANYSLLATDGNLNFNPAGGVNLTVNNIGNSGPFFITNTSAFNVTFVAGSSANISFLPATIPPKSGLTIYGEIQGGTTYYLSTGGFSLPGNANSGLSAALSSGTATVNTVSACTPSSTCVYKLTECLLNGSTGTGTLQVGTISAGVSFVINSMGPTATPLATDTSQVCWEIN